VSRLARELNRREGSDLKATLRSDGDGWEGSGDRAPGRLWIYVRDDGPFGGAGPPAAIFHYSRDRRGEHPQTHLIGYAGILQADAYDGYNKLYLADRKPSRSGRWRAGRMHGASSSFSPTSRRTRAASPSERSLSPIAIEVVRRIDAPEF
jgi:hypothetical protein